MIRETFLQKIEKFIRGNEANFDSVYSLVCVERWRLNTPKQKQHEYFKGTKFEKYYPK